MSRVKLRLAVWIIAAASAFLGQVVWLLLRPGDASDAWSIAALTVPLLVIAALLVTTPTDAIKLRRGTSDAAIFTAACVLQLIAAALLPSTQRFAIAGGTLAAAVLTLGLSRFFGISPWWAVLVLWNPLLMW